MILQLPITVIWETQKSFLLHLLVAGSCIAECKLLTADEEFEQYTFLDLELIDRATLIV